MEAINSFKGERINSMTRESHSSPIVSGTVLMHLPHGADYMKAEEAMSDEEKKMDDLHLTAPVWKVDKEVMMKSEGLNDYNCKVREDSKYYSSEMVAFKDVDANSVRTPPRDTLKGHPMSVGGLSEFNLTPLTQLSRLDSCVFDSTKRRTATGAAKSPWAKSMMPTNKRLSMDFMISCRNGLSPARPERPPTFSNALDLSSMDYEYSGGPVVPMSPGSFGFHFDRKAEEEILSLNTYQKQAPSHSTVVKFEDESESSAKSMSQPLMTPKLVTSDETGSIKETPKNDAHFSVGVKMESSTSNCPSSHEIYGDPTSLYKDQKMTPAFLRLPETSLFQDAVKLSSNSGINGRRNIQYFTPVQRFAPTTRSTEQSIKEKVSKVEKVSKEEESLSKNVKDSVNQASRKSSEVKTQAKPLWKRNSSSTSTTPDETRMCSDTHNSIQPMKLLGVNTANAIFCEPRLCGCNDCRNVQPYEKERQKAVSSALSRNPGAFSALRPTKKQKRAAMLSPDTPAVKRTCNCKKSACLKKYCECFFTKVYCSRGCRCNGCENFQGSAKLKEVVLRKEKENIKAKERESKSAQKVKREED
eukprot:scaffold14540_cov54-Attheya_sp.AAC.2